MKYKMYVKIVEPCDGRLEEEMTLDVCFCYDDQQYGNGYYVSIKGKEFYRQVIDLRYDQSFDSSRKEVWLENWAHSYWSGLNGAWSVVLLEIWKVS